MADVEELLRASLRARAEQLPVEGGLLAAVHRRSRRRKARRRATLIGAGTLAAALLAVTPAVVGTVRAPGVRPGSERAGTTAAASVSGPATTLVPWTMALPVFPFDEVLLPKRNWKPEVSYEEPAVTMQYGNESPLSVTVRPTGPTPPGTGGPIVGGAAPTTVRGHPATAGRLQDGRWTLDWFERPGQWVEVDGNDPLAVSRVAEHLTPAPVPVTAPFGFDLAPAGMVLSQVSASRMVFRVSDPSAAPTAAKVTVSLDEPPNGVASLSPTGRAVHVGPYPATITSGDGIRVLVIIVGGGPALSVQADGIAITDDDLIRFAAGIHINANPPG